MSRDSNKETNISIAEELGISRIIQDKLFIEYEENTNTPDKNKQLHQLRTKVMQAEQERLSDARTIDVGEARKKIRKRYDKK